MDYRYVAYIDEAGDYGIKTVKPIDKNGSSEWFILSAVVIDADRENEVAGWVEHITNGARSIQRQMKTLHFKSLLPVTKTLVCTSVANLPLRCFVVASNKQNMRGYSNPFAEQIPSKNWFYCWMSRILLERVTHYVKYRSVKRYGEPKKVKLEYSECGGLSYSQMNAYYEWLKIKSGAENLYLPLGDLAWETMDRSLLKFYPHKERPGLQIADIVASAFFKACDLHDTRECDPQFAKLLRPRMARSIYHGDNLISGYGVKLFPQYGKVRNRITAHQREIFDFYGYPKQWWDPDPSNPRAYRPPIYRRRPSTQTPRGRNLPATRAPRRPTENEGI